LIDVTKDAQQATIVPDWNIKLDLPWLQAELPPQSQAGTRSDQIAPERKETTDYRRSRDHHVRRRRGTARLRRAHPHPGDYHPPRDRRLPPEDHPLSIGMPGMHGWVHVNRAIQECDVLFNIGGRFDDRVTGKASTFAPNAKVIHVDIDPSEIGKNVKVTVPIVADARLALQAFLDEFPARPRGVRRTARACFRLDGAHSRNAGEAPAENNSTSTAPTPRT
jgi:acetolactate synthase-1/2/3 large subunit